MFLSGCISRIEAPPECRKCMAFHNGVCTCASVGLMPQDGIAYVVAKCHRKDFVMDAIEALDMEHSLKVVSDNTISGWIRAIVVRNLPKGAFKQCLKGIYGAAAWHIAKSALL